MCKKQLPPEVDDFTLLIERACKNLKIVHNYLKLIPIASYEDNVKVYERMLELFATAVTDVAMLKSMNDAADAVLKEIDTPA